MILLWYLFLGTLLSGFFLRLFLTFLFKRILQGCSRKFLQVDGIHFALEKAKNVIAECFVLFLLCFVFEIFVVEDVEKLNISLGDGLRLIFLVVLTVFADRLPSFALVSLFIFLARRESIHDDFLEVIHFHRLDHFQSVLVL